METTEPLPKIETTEKSVQKTEQKSPSKIIVPTKAEDKKPVTTSQSSTKTTKKGLFDSSDSDSPF